MPVRLLFGIRDSSRTPAVDKLVAQGVPDGDQAEPLSPLLSWIVNDKVVAGLQGDKDGCGVIVGSRKEMLDAVLQKLLDFDAVTNIITSPEGRDEGLNETVQHRFDGEVFLGRGAGQEWTPP